jgi:predicted ATP-grasp superfamily ATP-dependent carboligase
LRKISAHLGYHGILSGEFKQDPRDGVYKLLEINSRVWWFVEFTGRCGIDMCTMWYRDAMGQPLEDITSYKLGAKFVHAYYDFHAIRALWHAGKLGLLDAASSWFNAQEPYFNWTDPMPALFDLRERLRIRRRLLKPSLAAK